MLQKSFATISRRPQNKRLFKLKIKTMIQKKKGRNTYNKGEIMLHIHVPYSAEMVARNSKPIMTKFRRESYFAHQMNKTPLRDCCDFQIKHAITLHKESPKSIHCKNGHQLHHGHPLTI